MIHRTVLAVMIMLLLSACDVLTQPIPSVTDDARITRVLEKLSSSDPTGSTDLARSDREMFRAWMNRYRRHVDGGGGKPFKVPATIAEAIRQQREFAGTQQPRPNLSPGGLPSIPADTRSEAELRATLQSDLEGAIIAGMSARQMHGEQRTELNERCNGLIHNGRFVATDLENLGYDMSRERDQLDALDCADVDE